MNKKRVGLVGAAIGTAGAVGIGAAVAARRYAVGRQRLRPDPDRGEPFGELRGRPQTVVATDGVPLNVEVHEPDGPDAAALTVIFSHGWALTQDSWHFQRRDLAGLGGVRMVFWDQRSHGRSGRSDPVNATIDQCGDDLYAVIEATSPGTPMVLVGHSMGGMTIMALADQHPELFGDRVAGVALVNTSSGELGELSLGLPEAVGKVLRAAVPGVVRGIGRGGRLIDHGRRLGADLAFILTRRMAFADKDVSPSVVEFLERMIGGTPTDVITDFYPTLVAHDKLAALDVLRDLPSVVVVGDGDRFTPSAHGRAIAAALPSSELVEIADGGHAVMLEHHETVTDAIADLIERVRPVAEERSA